MERTILHCDMNSFYASVELLSRPDLKGFPVAVSGNPENRHGIILAKNDIAKSYGVVTAETIQQARKKCPGLICLPPHHKKYSHLSKLINGIYLSYTDMVEPFSIDESWLDVTASLKLFGDGKTIADEIRNKVKRDFGLTLSAGVSFNKIFAKMGSEYKKPDATTVITHDNFREILWPLHVSELFSCGKATTQKLLQCGIRTIGDLAGSDKELLSALLGEQGRILHEYANGLEDSPVARYTDHSRAKSLGHGITFKRDISGKEDIITAVTALSDKVCARLRSKQLLAGGVKVEIKNPQLKVISRQTQLPFPSNTSADIKKAAMTVIMNEWNINEPVRLITITAISLSGINDSVQMEMLSETDNEHTSQRELDLAMDRIRARYGDSSITFGKLIGNDIGIDISADSGEEDN